MFDRGKLTFTGRYGIASGGALTDPVLQSVAADFDNAVMRKIAGIAPADLNARCADDDSAVLVTTKYDGEGVFVYFEDGKDSFAFSPAGRVRLGFAALDELSQKLTRANVRKALLRCELVLADAPGARSGVAEVIRVSFSAEPEALDRLKLVGLDLVMLDGRDLRTQQAQFAQTFEQLQTMLGSDSSQRCHAMEGEVIAARAAPAAFGKRLEAGAEGIVLRRLNRAEAWKIKPHKTVDAVVIGFVEGEFEGQYGVTSLLTGLTYPLDGVEVFMQTFVRVGSGLTDAERVAMLERVRPLKVAAPLAMTDSSGRQVQFIEPKLVAEIHGEDLLLSEAGKDLKTQLLRWDAASQSYQFLGLSACPRLTFARFERLRDDKRWNDGGARIAQVTTLDKPALSERGGTPEIRVLRREVYAKGELLRKLLVIHKANADLPFPYLVYWTDFSARRAEPLKVTTEVAATEARATALAERALAENLTKGFVKI
jgi:ATP-dependent DNA ligase